MGFMQIRRLNFLSPKAILVDMCTFRRDEYHHARRLALCIVKAPLKL